MAKVITPAQLILLQEKINDQLQEYLNNEIFDTIFEAGSIMGINSRALMAVSSRITLEFDPQHFNDLEDESDYDSAGNLI
jgi:hypothetical protein